MPHDVVEDLVIEALRALSGEAQPVSSDALLAEISKTSKLPGDAIIRAIWRLADLDEIEFRDGRLLALGNNARQSKAA